jgi:hypothetical protein
MFVVSTSTRCVGWQRRRKAMGTEERINVTSGHSGCQHMCLKANYTASEITAK